MSAVNQARLESEAPEVDDDDSMLLLSIVPFMVPSGSSSSSHLFYPTKDFAIHHLQSALRASQEDISRIQEQFALRESLYLEEIVELKSKLNSVIGMKLCYMGTQNFIFYLSNRILH